MLCISGGERECIIFPHQVPNLQPDQVQEEIRHGMCYSLRPGAPLSPGGTRQGHFPFGLSPTSQFHVNMFHV